MLPFDSTADDDNLRYRGVTKDDEGTWSAFLYDEETGGCDSEVACRNTRRRSGPMGGDLMFSPPSPLSRRHTFLGTMPSAAAAANLW